MYGECAHEQHLRRTLTLTLTHTITAYSVSGNVVRVHIQCESNKVAHPLKLYAIFSLRPKYRPISVKLRQFIASIYPNILTSFGRFNLIFNKMALIFIGVLIVFTVSSFEFHQVKSP